MSKILEKEILLNSLIKNTNKLLLEDNEINNSDSEIYSALSDDLNNFSLSDIKIEKALFNLIENKKTDEKKKIRRIVVKLISKRKNQ